MIQDIAFRISDYLKDGNSSGLTKFINELHTSNTCTVIHLTSSKWSDMVPKSVYERFDGKWMYMGINRHRYIIFEKQSDAILFSLLDSGD